ncbi:MAG: hypothetical protein ACLUNU_00955 [Anaerobutyricum soehngenii]
MANKLETTQVTFNDEKITCARFTIDDISVPFVLKNIAVTGKDYTFSLYLKSNSASSISVEGNNITSITAWTRQYVTFSATKANVEISFNKTGTYYFYNTQLETGKICSDWTPNPEDISEDVLNAETIAKQTATKFSWLVKSGTNESNFEITDRVINLISKNINLDGIVTFMNTAKGEVCKNLYVSTGYADFESIKSTDEAICYAKLDSNSVAIDSSTYWQGSNSLKISGTAKDRVRVYLGNKENDYGCIKVEQGKTYQITAYVKSDSEQNVSFGIDLITHGTKIDAATGTCYIESYLFNPQKPSIPKGCTTITPNTSWQRAITTFTVTDKTNSYYYISIVPTIYNQLSKNANFWVDGIMVEEVESLNSEPNEFTNSAKATIIDGNSILTDSITADKLTANSITAEKIMADALKSKNYVTGESGSFLNLADGSFDSKYLKWDNAGKVIANDITVVGGSINVNDKFIVNNDGIATLQGATVVGNITAESGKIGKFDLDNLALVTGDTDVTCAGLGGSSQAFWAGSLSMDNAPFRVGYDGKLYASDADISGVINSTDGSIGGWKISNEGIKSFYSHIDTVDTGILDSSNSLSLLSDTSSIILNYDGKTYSDSSRKKILERQVDSLSLNEYLIQGSSKYTVYGEENEENDYSFYLSAINGLEMWDNISGDNTAYSCNGITFNNRIKIDGFTKVLWEGVNYMSGDQTITFYNETVSDQLNGIALVWSRYNTNTHQASNSDVHIQFIPKWCVEEMNGAGHAFIDPYRHFDKYFRVYNDKIVGNDVNGNPGTEGGLSYDNRNCVLRAVIGV